MVDPVIAADGYTYDRSTIAPWFAKHGPVSMITKAPMPQGSTELLPNRLARDLIARCSPRYRLAKPQQPCLRVIPTRSPLSVPPILPPLESCFVHYLYALRLSGSLIPYFSLHSTEYSSYMCTDCVPHGSTQ